MSTQRAQAAGHETAFAVAWLAQAGLMSLSAVGGLGVSVLFAVLSVVAKEQPVSRGALPWLLVYPLAAAVQLVLGAFALKGAIGILRGNHHGAVALRQASRYLLTFLGVTWLFALIGLMAFLGWRHPIVVMSTAILLPTGFLLAVLPAATLKWLARETA